ncbi:lipopolysaccharide biosynthesis protein [uncultured Bacteroides sp.]|uniref:lipopolysaccharide biosynthesis protein n=1 Tax=uncultured Bacteroides sp. TaxID=162156 RepID=UPI0025DB01C5|nr:sugar transporter [uncultured Bacteroides sp.]
MAETSRTAKSIKNAQVALVFYFINLVLQFFSRKIFLDYLGAEVLGLNTTAQNLLGFLNLAELGIGGAVSYALYKPLFNKDTRVINEIVSVQGWLYRRVAVVVVVAACVLMCFFPLIFEKAEVPLWYTYASFVALLFSALLGYVFNYRQIVLSADQKEYKITLSIQGVKVLKVILQIAAIACLANGYVYWLLLEILMGIATALAIEYVLRKEYPWLHPQPRLGGQLRKKHAEIIRKTKQIFFHKIGGFAFTQSGSIIIYAYASLSLVAVYGNYMLVATGLQMLLGAVFNSINAGIGNLVAEDNKERAVFVFNELFSLRFYLVAVVCYGYYMLVGPFISLWIGGEYLLDHTTLLLITTILFIDLIRAVIGSFCDAYGLFQDVWATLVEACVNIVCSVWFGSIWGLPGILSGVLLSLFLMIFLWKPYFLFRYGFKISVSFYWKLYFRYFISGMFAALICSCLSRRLFVSSCDNFLSLVLYRTIPVFVFGIILFAILYTISRAMRQSVSRLFLYIGSKRKCS